MPEYPDRVVTEILSSEQMEQGLRVLGSMLRNLLGEAALSVSYGWGCELHPSLCYIPLEVGTTELERFMADSLRQQIVLPGDSDLHVHVPKRLTIVFCHEGHIHSSGNDFELETRFWACEPFCQFPLSKNPFPRR